MNGISLIVGEKREKRRYFFMAAIDLLTVLSKRPLGLVFDLDGTLSPMTPTPDTARL